MSGATLSGTKPVETPSHGGAARYTLPLFLLTVIVITVCLYWRRPDAFVNPQLWAEDGEVFFTDSYFHGPDRLFVPYRGIYHLLGRLATWPGRFVPLPFIPHYYYAAAWLMLVALTGFIFSRRIDLSLPLKCLMALALVANAADHEVFFNIANWTTISSLWWLLLLIATLPKSRWGQIGDVILLILNGANTAFAVVLWPLFIGRWWLTRERHHAWLAVVAPLLGAVQLLNMGGRIPAGTAWPQFSPRLADVLIARFGFMFVGEWIYGLPETAPIRIGGVVLMVALLGGMVWDGIRRQNWSAVMMIAAGLAATTLSVYVNRLMNPDTMLHWSGRHYYLPVVTVAWGLLLWRPARALFKWVPLTLIGVTFLFLTPGHKNQVFPDLDWAGEVAACTGTQPRCKIPILPVWEPLRWFATIDSHIEEEPPAAVSFQTTFGDQIELRGYTLSPTADLLTVELVWYVVAEPDGSYTQFVHLVDPAQPGHIVAQRDTIPQNGRYLTDQWQVGEYIIERFDLPRESIPAGEYALFIGWYDAAAPDLARLPAVDGSGTRWPADYVPLPTTVQLNDLQP